MPRSLTWVLLLAVCASCSGAGSAPARTPVVSVGPTADLQALFDTLKGPATVRLATGDYHLTAVAFTDSTCGNCRDPDEDVPATRGLLIRGDSIRLEGASAREVVLHTHAGYGILFDGCAGCALEAVTVTDGARDADGRATDAGVVIRHGHVTLSDCVIRDNLGDSATVHSVVVGIMGVAVREGGHGTIRGCHIERNSWDGIAGYRDASLLAVDNLVDGVDKARGAQMGGGRGVGIGLTWNARGVIRSNLVTRYWKGIGVFVNAQASITANVVEDVLTWGMAYWGPDGGRPVAVMDGNAVFETGACGVIVDRAAPWSPEVHPGPPRDGLDALAAKGPGELVGNAIVRTGQDERYDTGEPYCWQRPIARHNVPEGFRIADNLVYDVRQPGDSIPTEDVLDAAAFARAAAPLLRQLARSPVLARSRFLGAFGDGR
jgi:hypothetical protein